MDVDNFCRIMDDIADQRDKLDIEQEKGASKPKSRSDWISEVCLFASSARPRCGSTPADRYRACMVRVAAVAVGAIRAYDARKEADGASASDELIGVAAPPDDPDMTRCSKDCAGCIYHSCSFNWKRGWNREEQADDPSPPEEYIQNECANVLISEQDTVAAPPAGESAPEECAGHCHACVHHTCGSTNLMGDCKVGFGCRTCPFHWCDQSSQEAVPPADDPDMSNCARDCYGCVHHTCDQEVVFRDLITGEEWPFDYRGGVADRPVASSGRGFRAAGSEGAVRHLIPFGEKIDLSRREEWREYIFPGAVKIRIDTPLFLIVSDSGHRVLDGAGISHYISKGWVHLQWKNKPGHTFWCESGPTDHDLEEDEVKSDG